MKTKKDFFSYDVATETVTMEVTVDGGAEGEAGTEQGQAQTQTVTFTKHTYTVVYAGDSYFADHVFHLTRQAERTCQKLCRKSDMLSLELLLPA